MLKKASMRRFKRARRASVAVEFALVSTFILMPLFGAGADFIQVLTEQAQLNTTLQSLYYFGYSNPTLASNTGDLTAVVQKINNYATHQAAFGGVTMSYDCISIAGIVIPAIAGPPASCAPTLVLQTFATYSVSGNAFLTIPLPGRSGTPTATFPMTASGKVQIQ